MLLNVYSNWQRPKQRKLINHYLKYPEDSAGSIMTSEYTRLTKGMTVKEAIEYIRHYGEDRETNLYLLCNFCLQNFGKVWLQYEIYFCQMNDDLGLKTLWILMWIQRFYTTEDPGKSCIIIFIINDFLAFTGC